MACTLPAITHPLSFGRVRKMGSCFRQVLKKVAYSVDSHTEAIVISFVEHTSAPNISGVTTQPVSLSDI